MNPLLLIPKKWLIALAVGIATVVVVIGGLIMINGEEDYRQIQVYKTEGSATVERQGSFMEAYDNMQLQSGDILETAADSYVQLKLDEDKYILMEPDTKVHLEASGNSQDSKTRLYLDKGAIVNEIENPLSADSEYQVTTPNSTMAVRGTTFRVEVTYDEETGKSYTSVAVYNGKVETRLVFPDGTIDAEPVMVEMGTEVLIWGDDTDSDYVGTGKAEYDKLKIRVLEFLRVVLEQKESSITVEELDALIEELQSESEEETTEDSAEELTEEVTTEEESEEEESEEEEESSEQTKPSTPAPAAEEAATTETEEETTAPSVPPSSSDDSGDSENDESTGGGGSGGGSGNGGGGGDSGSTEPSTATVTIEITFKSGTETFATQSVETTKTTTVTKTETGTETGTETETETGTDTEAETTEITYDPITVRKPVLQPGASGKWVDSNGNDVFGSESTATINITDANGITLTWN